MTEKGYDAVGCVQWELDWKFAPGNAVIEKGSAKKEGNRQEHLCHRHTITYGSIHQILTGSMTYTDSYVMDHVHEVSRRSCKSFRSCSEGAQAIRKGFETSSGKISTCCLFVISWDGGGGGGGWRRIHCSCSRRGRLDQGDCEIPSSCPLWPWLARSRSPVVHNKLAWLISPLHAKNGYRVGKHYAIYT